MKQNGTAGNAPQPQFGLSAPTFNFDALIDGTRSTPFVYELDLSTARSFAAGTAVQIKITGNCLLIDSAPDVGNGYVIFEGVQDYTAGQVRAPIYAQPGFVTRLPFANVYVANAAQPGKKLRFIYGVDLDFQMMFPARMAAVEQGHDYQATFTSQVALAIGAVETVFTPAQNVSGAVIWHATQIYQSANITIVNLLAKAGAAPANNTDGDVLMTGVNQFGANTPFVTLLRPIMIPAGKGVYWANGFQAIGVRTCNVLYSFL
jgi:hypothetical protein